MSYQLPLPHRPPVSVLCSRDETAKDELLAHGGMPLLLAHTTSAEMEIRIRATRAIATLCRAHAKSHDAFLSAGGVEKLLAAVKAHVDDIEEAEEVALWALRALSSAAVDHVGCRKRLVSGRAEELFERFAVIGSTEVVKRDAAAAAACCADAGESDSFTSGLRAASISSVRWTSELHGPGEF